MRLRDFTCPLHEMAAFNYIRGSDDVLAFFPSRAGRVPHTILFPLDNHPKTANNFLVLTIRPKVGNNYKWSLIEKQRVPGAVMTDAEEVFLNVWNNLIPYLGVKNMNREAPLLSLAQKGYLNQLFPKIFNAVEMNGRDKLYHYMVTQGLDHSTFTQYLGDIPQQQAAQQGEMINNATVFFPANMQPKRKQMMVQFLDAAHDVLQRNGIGDLFTGPIVFVAKLPGNTIGDWDKSTGYMRIQPNTQKDKTNLFTLIHEYGHKYWDQAMNEDQRQAVKEQYIERIKAGDRYQSEGGKLDAVYKAAEEIIKPGIQVKWVGRGKKFAGTWEVTSVFPWMDITRGIKTNKYSAKLIATADGETVIRSPTMGGVVAALLNDKKWKILNADVEDIPALSSASEQKADIVTDQWFPTKYSESKLTEWWAELFGVHMLGNLKGEPGEWMKDMLSREVRK